MKENTTAVTAEEVKKEERHVLADYNPDQYASFKEWKKSWDSTKKHGDKLGLLHELQRNKKAFERELAVPFLLKLADGYLSTSYVFNAYSWSTQDYQRAEIVQKAFSVLLVTFFKWDKKQGVPLTGHYHPWGWVVKNKEAYDTVIWFFTGKRSTFGNFRPARVIEPNDHAGNTILQFLREFISFSWEEEPTSYHFPDLIAFTARPKIIEILYGLGELDWLFGKDLDEKSIEKLKMIALSEKLYFPQAEVITRVVPRCIPEKDCRTAQNLEEAVFGGSAAAYVLLIHESKERQKALFQQKYDALLREYQEQEQKKKIEETKQKLAELDAERAALEKQIK